LVWFRFSNGRLSMDRHSGLACSYCYWHFVDVVWIYLFYLLYLSASF